MSLISGTIRKNSETDNVGIAFNRRSPNSPLMISWLRADGPFSKTDLVVGLLLQSINGIDCTQYTPQQANAAIRNAKVGDVAVVGRGIIATAFKEEANEKIGIGLRQHHVRVRLQDELPLPKKKKTKRRFRSIGRCRKQSAVQKQNISTTGTPYVTIHTIAEDGLFKYSDHLVGLQVASVNGKLSNGMMTQTLRDLRTAKEQISLVVWDEAWASFVTPQTQEERSHDDSPIIIAEESKEEYDFFLCGMGDGLSQKKTVAVAEEQDPSFFTWACGNNDLDAAIEAVPSKAYDLHLLSSSDGNVLAQ